MQKQKQKIQKIYSYYMLLFYVIILYVKEMYNNVNPMPHHFNYANSWAVTMPD